MKLITKALEKQIPPLYSQENVKDPLCVVKFFCPWNNWTWYGIEWDGSNIFFGYVSGHENELGYFSLKELMELRGPGGLRIERDMYFKPILLSKVEEYHKGGL